MKKIIDTYSDIRGGRRYFGESEDSLEDGIGFYSLDLWKQKFVGEFKKDKANGIGLKIQGPDQDYERKIVCEFVDNAHEGIGMYVWPSGAKYVGHFKNDVTKGLGMFVTWEGLKYIGNMSLDDENIGVQGIGIKGDDFWIRGDGFWYDQNDNLINIEEMGYDKHGFKRIENIEYWPDGTFYEGQFDKNGLYSGYGRLTFSKSRYYQGEFAKGHFNGEGIFWHGEEYIKGQFKNSEACGEGEGVFEHGYYKGGFKVNKFHGKGKLVYKDNVYDGEFNNIVINPGGGRDTGFKKC